ncbi:CbtA family protein [Loktanella sp. F6476L]|uniref:CbtA family protein n=1 Tax=Loktanella sp. F6476L TaxID=2926405 RepID=UPI001FF6BC47|nr:CbtA family protein [Loktanella sp. F6476L]MCK0121142.1 CbtA family protein [Loktanella sp. F6476L]
MFSKVVVSALIAGFGAGLFAAVLQFAFVQPILLHAELFETGVLTHFGADPSAAHVAHEGGIDIMRDGLSIMFSALIYVGYALMLLALMVFAEERGQPITARTGLIWGIAGWIAVQMAPAFGLAPELPGMNAADVDARQIWWFATVAATGLGLWFIAFGRNWAMWGVAIILLAAPHIIGAPMPDTLTGPAPPELGAEFAARAIGTGLAVWALLGLLLGAVWSKNLGEA